MDTKILAVNIANCVLPKTGISATKYLESKSTEGALEALKQLAPKFDRVYLLYKSTKDTNLTRVAEWLKYNDILKTLGLVEENVIFVSDGPKMYTVLDKLGVTHMVHDDIYFVQKVTDLDKIVLFDNKPYPSRLLPEEKKFISLATSWEQTQKILETNISIIEI